MDHDEFQDRELKQYPVISQKASVKEIIFHSPRIASLTLQLEKEMKWSAGQYVLIEEVVEGQKETRAYTMTSSPLNTNKIQLTIMRTDDPTISNVMLEKKPGDEVSLKGPYGNFVLPTKIPHKLVFLAVNIAINPFIAMIRYLRDIQEQAEIKLFYYWTHTLGRILFLDQLSKFREEYKGKLEIHVYAPHEENIQRKENIRVIRSTLTTSELQKEKDAFQKGYVYICGEKAITNPWISMLSKARVNISRLLVEQWF